MVYESARRYGRVLLHRLNEAHRLASFARTRLSTIGAALRKVGGGMACAGDDGTLEYCG